MGEVKLVCVGDGAVGKTCLMIVYATGTFPDGYVPTVFENYKCKVKTDEREINVQMWDTAGQEELENIRTLSYANTDLFMLCFAVNDRPSWENIESKWIKEIREHTEVGSNPKFMIVGTKTDLRDATPQAEVVSPEEGQSLADKVGALGYSECSALKNEGVKEVFDKAIVDSLSRKLSKSKDSEGGRCCEVQ